MHSLLCTSHPLIKGARKASESELHFFHVVRHFLFIILLAPHKASAPAACDSPLKNSARMQKRANLLCPIQNMLRRSSFSFTATTADTRPRLTMSA